MLEKLSICEIAAIKICGAFCCTQWSNSHKICMMHSKAWCSMIYLGALKSAAVVEGLISIRCLDFLSHSQSYFGAKH